MKIEKFNVVKTRFHAADDNVVVIQGWKYGMSETEHLEAALNGTALPMREEKCDGMEVRQRYTIYDLGIEEEYFLYITLPEHISGKEELVLWSISGEERTILYRIPGRELLKLRKQADFFIEQITIQKDSCQVYGWAAGAKQPQVSVQDRQGRAVEHTITWNERKDVCNSYLEGSVCPECGFQITIPHKKSGIKLVITAGNRQSSVTLPLRMTRVLEKLPGGGIMGKGVRFLQQYGWKSFCRRAWKKLSESANRQNSYEIYRRKVSPNAEELKKQRETQFACQPKFSIVVPLYKTPKKYLQQLVESVQKQTYGNWELCLSDGSGKDSPLTGYLRSLSKADPRIKVISGEKPLQISENTNAAMKRAAGDFIVFADHDDLLTENALYECVKVINELPETELIYSDEDKVSMNGKKYFQPHFKSDYNPDLLCSMNYFCHLVVVKKELADRAGYLNPEYDGAQDYDFVLRCTEQTSNIRHIPKVLYHWRAHENSTAENPESKRYAFEAGKRAVQAHYDRIGVPAQAEEGPYPGLYRTTWLWKDEPLISILIPNKDHIEDLDKCIRSIEEKSDYHNYEFIIIENNSEEEATFDYYKKLMAENAKAHVVYWEKEFNYSAINNFGAKAAHGEYLLLLNNDTEIINPGCLRELLGFCQREDVGIVGARLYYPDNTVQHAGVVVGFGGIAGHAFIGLDRSANGYFSRIICAQDYSAVTAACMMTKKSLFEEVGGLTEELKVAFNDIDYCMKVRNAGKLVVYNPYAELYHYESKSRGLEDSPEKKERYYQEMEYFVKKWPDIMEQGDPYYNPNLTLSKADFSLRQV